MSIKDPGFVLPVIWPERYIKTFGTGANQPILISGTEEKSGITDDYVVKLNSSERMDETACLRELLACFMAMEMEIPIVEPVITNIEDEFISTLKGKDCYERVRKSKGINFATRFIKNGYQTLLPSNSLNTEQLEFAKNIFWFDLLIQNPDRTNTKPNMLTNGKEIVILDHELAYSFIMLIGGDSEPWIITREKWPEFSSLILSNKLNKVVFSEAEIAEKISKLNNDFWQSVNKYIPDNWKNEMYINKIMNHINLVQENIHSFVLHIQNISK
tara:strand:+ start:247 stop:1062 length:816 start_codon:yes stop_codon:yes gene_type:complete